MLIVNLEELKQHALDCYPQEMCGVIVNNWFIPVENVASDPANCFQFSQENALKFATAQAIIHSHTMDKFKEDARIPSREDMISAEASGIPFGIVHCTQGYVSDILWFNETEIMPLLGRKYITNVLDCFTLARDYYRIHNNVDFGLHPRPQDWQEWDAMYIETHYLECGFKVKQTKTYDPGDILLLAIGSPLINHIGVAINPTTFIHHLHNKVSCEDKIDKWKRQIKLTLAYKG
jgi:proteasome lid subunit RPN8/RPN11